MPMTEKQKAETFDLLQQKKVIQIRKGSRNGKSATWVEHGENKNTLVGDFAMSLEAEAAEAKGLG
jgi:hypothetical protein